jgi:FkbM family methyltransferase
MRHERLRTQASQIVSQVRESIMSPFRRSEAVQGGPAQGLIFEAGPNTRHFVTGEYERPVQEALAAIVKPGDVCYDIGANLGFFSALLGRLTGPTGSVVAFEPVPGIAAHLERCVQRNRLRNVRVCRMAVSDTDSSCELQLARHIGGAVLKGAGAPPDPAGCLVVRAARLESLVAEFRLPPPDLVKIDVEGAELSVLHGMEGIIRARAPAIVMEFDDQSEAICEQKLATCEAYLRGFGYRFRRLRNSYPDGRWFVRHVLALASACESSRAGIEV